MSLYKNNKILIDNYFENRQVDEIAIQSFLQKYHANELEFIKAEQKQQSLSKSVELVHYHAEFVCFQDVVQIQHCASGRLLSAFVDDIAIPNSVSCTITASESSTPCVRTAFYVVRDEEAMKQYVADFDDRFSPNDSILRYGQKFHIVAHPELCSHQLALYSELKSFRAFSKASNKQILCLHAPVRSLSSFVIVHPDPDFALEMEGEPVRRGESFIIKHAQTGSVIDCGDARVYTDISVDVETFCCKFNNKSLWKLL
ncbi:hypothetical protein RCL1_005461 [Eukaryota sp. TZLM3-RCL]